MPTLYPITLREEELKLRVAKDFFSLYDTTHIVGNVDFCVAVPNDRTLFKGEIESLVWGEAKAGTGHDLYHSFVQLILTIGKARTFDRHLPPQYLAAFDCQKFAFIPYHIVQDVFYQNDFNWNITPSDHQSKEFLQLYELVEQTLRDNAFVYNYIDDEKAFRKFIRENLILGNHKTRRHKVNKNNFTFVYQRWCNEVKHSIQINWDKVKQVGLLDADFFLADLLSKDGNYLLDSLHVLLKHDHYQFDRHLDEFDLFTSREARFTDNMQAHTAFWNKYERPPKREYWGYIVERRDLLVPQDVRERKGSFFTPRQWVELSQQYLADTLGEDWQDNYYIWDCCAGTGNLLNGLNNPARIWASTLDKADVDVMHERIRNGANLFDNHVFQFDFLNDSFDRLPWELQTIISDPEKRQKLVIYINPPYAEATTATTVSGTGQNKAKVATENAVYRKYKSMIGKASNELFAQFFIRIYQEIPGATLAEFSKLKILQASNFADFRKIFRARLLRAFAVPANTFDNVRGQFPIGFFIWDLNPDSTIELSPDNSLRDTYRILKGYDTGENTIVDIPYPSSENKIETPYGTISEMQDLVVGTRVSPPAYKECCVLIDIYNSKGEYMGQKKVFPVKFEDMLNRWLDTFRDKGDKAPIGYMPNYPSDFQNQNKCSILSVPQKRYCDPISKHNVGLFAINLAVRHCIDATWLNDRDQFLYPQDGWQSDRAFQLDCLVYTLFHNQNRITAENGVNHWLPFTEQQLGITEGFASHFMQDYLKAFIEGTESVGNTLLGARASSPASLELWDSVVGTRVSSPASLGNESVLPTSDVAFASNAGEDTRVPNNPAIHNPNDADQSCEAQECLTTKAQAVLDSGLAVYKYYHEIRKQRGGELNASLYDIKLYFKGRNEKGNMNAVSTDEHFNHLMDDLRLALQALARQIEPKVYQYGFLK